MNDTPDRITTRHYSRTGIINARAFGEPFMLKDTSASAEGDYLRATPARLHAEELAGALRDCCIWMDIARESDYYGGWEWEPDDEYTRATNLLARVEGEKP